MPIYNVQAPNGRIYQVEGPPDAPDDALIDTLHEYLSSQPAPKTGIVSAAVSGAESLGSDIFTGASALLGDPNKAAKAGLERAQWIEDRHANEVSLDKVKEAFHTQGVLGGFGEIAHQAPLALSGMSPFIASGIAGAKIGARVAGPGGGLLAAIVGAAAPSLFQRFGSNIQQQAKESEDESKPIDIKLGRAMAAAPAQAALDVAAQFVPFGRSIMGRVFGPEMKKLLETGASQASEKLAEEGLLKAMAKGTMVGAAEQAPIQVAQTMLGRLQSGQSLTDDEAMHEYGESMYLAGLLSPMGAIGRVSDRSAARDVRDAKIQLEQNKNIKDTDDTQQANREAPVPEEPVDELYETAKEAIISYGKPEEIRDQYVGILGDAGIESPQKAHDYLRKMQLEDVISARDPDTKLRSVTYVPLDQRPKIIYGDEAPKAAVAPEATVAPKAAAAPEAAAPEATVAPEAAKPKRAPTEKAVQLRAANVQKVLDAIKTDPPEPGADVHSYIMRVLGLGEKHTQPAFNVGRDLQDIGVAIPSFPNDKYKVSKRHFAKQAEVVKATEEPTNAGATDTPIAETGGSETGSDRGSFESDFPRSAPADPTSTVAAAAGLDNAGEPAVVSAAGKTRAKLTLKDKAAAKAREADTRELQDAEILRELAARRAAEAAKTGPTAEELRTPEQPTASEPAQMSPEGNRLGRHGSFINLSLRIKRLMEHIVKDKGDNTPEYIRAKALLDVLQAEGHGKNREKALPRINDFLTKMEIASRNTVRKGFFTETSKGKPVDRLSPEERTAKVREHLTSKKPTAINDALTEIRSQLEGFGGEDKLLGRLADVLSTLDFRQSKVFVEGVDKDKAKQFDAMREQRRVAKYSSKENALYFLEEGVSDEGVLHEALHGATVNIVYQYLKSKELTGVGRVVKRIYKEDAPIESGKGDKKTFKKFGITQQALKTDDKIKTYRLDGEDVVDLGLSKAEREAVAKGYYDDERPQQAEAVQHLVDIFDHAKPILGEKYKQIFGIGKESIYEFITHAMTDKTFRDDLAQHNAKHLAKYSMQNKSLWAHFTAAIAHMFGLDKGRAHEGNLAIEASEAIHKILSSPKQKTAGVKDLALTKSAERKGEPDPNKHIKDRTLIAEQTHSKAHNAKETAKYYFGTSASFERLVKLWQNDRRPLKTLEDRLRTAGKLITELGRHVNNAYELITLSSGKAFHNMVGMIDPHIRDVQKNLDAYAKKENISLAEASERIGAFLMAEHEPERRRIKYIKNVPFRVDKEQLPKQFGISFSHELSAADARKQLLESLYKDEDLVTNGVAKNTRKYLDWLADNKYDVEGHSPLGRGMPVDPNARHYDVVGDHPREFFEKLREMYAQDKLKNGVLLKGVVDGLEAIQRNTKKLDKDSNYWSRPVDNIAEMYGYKNYMPFKGKPGSKVSEGDDTLELSGKRLGGEFADFPNAFEGRISDADNVIFQTMADGTKAAMRAGRAGVTERIKNLINQKSIVGEKLKTIKFSERFIGIDPIETKGENVILHYTPNGTIEIYKIHDTEMRESIRRTYKADNYLTELANRITSGIGMMHTRYNPAFHPYNFIRDAITNSFVIGADHGTKELKDFWANTLDTVTSTVGGGGLFKAGKFAALYEDGKFAEIDAWGKKDTYIKDMMEFMESGGAVQFVKGMSIRSQFEQLQREVGKSGKITSLGQFNRYAQIWSQTFEISARAAAYSAVKKKFREGGASEESARTQAAAYTKNLANFEQVGTFGKQAGAVFMFFRPSATGAVRAIDSVLPAFMKADTLLRQLPPEVRADPKAVETFRANHAIARKQARGMLATIGGAGMAMYFMALAASDNDEQGRNRVATDDMSIWQRNARLPIPGTDKFFNLPWGFGFGAFGAIGAQTAAMAAGNLSLKDWWVNSAQIGLDSFLPLPVSKIDPRKSVKNFFAAIADTVFPSAMRPIVEYAMDTDALGREIYNDRVSKYGEAFSGGESVPEIYKDIASGFVHATNGGIILNPSSISFFANNYIDGVGRVAQNVMGIGQWITGRKDFDPKTDFALLSSFIGKKASYDGREYDALQTKIQGMQERLNMFKNQSSESYNRYTAAHPEAAQAVDYFNKQANGQLKAIKGMIKAAQANREITPRERKVLIDQYRLHQNMLKRTMIDTLKNLGVEPY